MVAGTTDNELLKAEVGDKRFHVGVEEDLGGLDVAMDKLLVVDVSEPSGNSSRDLEPVFEREVKWG